MTAQQTDSVSELDFDTHTSMPCIEDCDECGDEMENGICPTCSKYCKECGELKDYGQCYRCKEDEEFWERFAKMTRAQRIREMEYRREDARQHRMADACERRGWVDA